MTELNEQPMEEGVQRSERDWHRVHPLTPILRAWSVLLALTIFFATAFSNQFVELVRMLFSNSLVETLQALGIVAVAILGAFLASLLWWRVTGYNITDHDVAFKNGLLRSKIRTARHDRIQGVDVVQPLYARLFGLAAVRIETAGGVNSRIEVGYLHRQEATKLRTILLGEDTPGEELVAPIPVWRTFTAAFFSNATMFTIAWTALTLAFELTPATIIPVLFGTVPNIWRTLDGSYQFTARRIDNTIAVTYGLANLQRKAVPVERVHAAEVFQPALWRPFGWWRVRVSVAGYGEGFKGAVLLPVGSYENAVRLVEEVGLAFDTLAPRAINPEYTSPKRARLVSPFDAHTQAFTLTDTLAIAHSGWASQKISIVFRTKIQEFSVLWGPIQQLIRLSSLRMHLVQGPVKMTAQDLSIEDTKALFRRLAGHLEDEVWGSGVRNARPPQTPTDATPHT